MRRRRLGSAAVVATIAMTVFMAIGFLAQREVATSAFDRLEATQVSQDAERIRIGLESWVALTRNYGATNSIWDASYADVAGGDRASFTADFPPADVRGIYGLDAVVGVGPDGAVRAGGIAAGDAYAPLPAGMDAATLRALVDPSARAGEGRCGVTHAAASAFVYCGFAARRSDGGGKDVGGLLYLRALSGGGTDALGRSISMPLALGDAPPAGRPSTALPSALGVLRVTTRTLSPLDIDLAVAVPAAHGGTVVIHAGRPRPIHDQAVSVSTWLMAITGVLGAVALTVALWTSAHEVRRRVRPLRVATAQVVAGDRSIRLPVGSAGPLGALCRDVNDMLDALASQDDQLAAAAAEREQQARAAHEQQRGSARMLRERAQSAVDDTVASVLTELDGVSEHAEAVRGTVAAVGGRAEETVRATGTARDVVASGQRTAQQATANLRQVGGVIETISAVAAQTHLLALNATIEAARAGAAGQGFAVVAHEVKQLAGSTAASTAQITETLTALQADVAAMTGTIDALSGVVTDVGATAGDLSGISSDQGRTMLALDERLRQARHRVSELATVTDTIERRGHERLPGRGAVKVDRPGADALDGEVVDVSASGVRLRTAVPIPVGSEVHLRVPDGPHLPAVAARVVRSAAGPSGPETALAFAVPEGADTAALVEALRPAGL